MIPFLIFFVCFNQNIIIVSTILLSFENKMYNDHFIKLVYILLTIILMPGLSILLVPRLETRRLCFKKSIPPHSLLYPGLKIEVSHF